MQNKVFIGDAIAVITGYSSLCPEVLINFFRCSEELLMFTRLVNNIDCRERGNNRLLWQNDENLNLIPG